jgi:hypothetical protein
MTSLERLRARVVDVLGALTGAAPTSTSASCSWHAP